MFHPVIMTEEQIDATSVVSLIDLRGGEHPPQHLNIMTK